MTVRIVRTEPEFGGGSNAVVTWRDVTGELERLVFADARIASSTDRLCALYTESLIHSAELTALGIATKGWERRLSELLRGIDALGDPSRSFGGARADAMRAVRAHMLARVEQSGSRDREAGSATLAARAATLDEATLRAVLRAPSGVCFVDPLNLSPVEDALVRRALSILPEATIEVPLPDLPLDASRPRDPLEAAAAWAEQHYGNAVMVELLPRAWGVQRGDRSGCSMEVRAVSNVFAQAEEIARDVIEQMDRGVPLDRMAIVCDQEARRDQLVWALRDAGIAVVSRSDANQAFRLQLCRSARVVRYAAARFPNAVWDDLAALLQNGPTNAHRQAGHWLAAHRGYASSIGAAVERNDAPAALRDIASTLGELEAAAHWDTLFAATARLLEQLGTEREWGQSLAACWSYQSGMLGARALEDISARARASAVALETLDELGRSLQRTGGHTTPASLELLALALEDAESKGKPASRAISVGALRIGTANEFAGSEMSLVYLCDMTADKFPARPSQAPAGLVESDAHARERRRNARWEVYAAVARLSQSAERVIALVPNEGESREALDSAEGLQRGERKPTSPAATLPPADVLLRAEREWSRRTLRGTTEVLGQVKRHAQLAEATGARRSMAVTQLERFAQCPFQGYVSVILGARDDADASWFADPRELGTARHEVLHHVFEAVKTLLWEQSPRRAEVLTRARAAFDVWAESDGAKLRGAIDTSEREAIWPMVQTALEMALDDTDYVYSSGERDFGKAGSEIGALSIAAADGAVLLHGRIDRIDMLRRDNKRLRVVDYKSSRSKATLGDIGVSVLQAPLYAEALRRDADAPAHEWAYLYPRSGEKVDGSSKRGEAIDRVSMSLERAASLVDAVRAGNIRPAPAKNACATCEARGVCRFDARVGVEEESGE